MKHKSLNVKATAIVWSPKLQRLVQLIGSQIWLAEVVDSRPDIVAFNFPGPEIEIDPGKKVRLNLGLQYRNGAMGAMHYLGSRSERTISANDIQLAAQRIGLQIEILNRAYFEKNDAHLSAWRSLVRWIHPKVVPSSSICQDVNRLVSEKGRISIHDLIRQTGSETPLVYNAVAVLAYSGHLDVSTDSGAFNSSTKVWRRQCLTNV